MAVQGVTRRPKPLTPFTPEHFKRYAYNLVLDNGERWVVEDFQIEVLQPIFDGVKETWAIIPEGNAKTTLLAGFGLYHCDYTVRPWVPIAASSRDQAEIMAKQAYEMIRHSKGMEWNGREGRFKIFEGYREIRSMRNGGRGIKVYAADVTTADGVIPTLCICDEGHRYPHLGIYRLWKGKLSKRHGQIVMVSTAGEPGSDFENQRDDIRNSAPHRQVTAQGCHIRSTGPGVVMNEWAVPKVQEIRNIKIVKLANPLSTITEEELADDLASPTTDIGLWQRLKCNIPARAKGSAITDQEWDDIRANVPQWADLEGEPCILGIDVAWKHDTFAIVPMWEGVNFNLLGPASVITPPPDGSMIHPDDVKLAIEEIDEHMPIQIAVMDIGRGEDIVAWLEDELGIEVVDRSQGNALQAEDYEAFTRAMRAGTKAEELEKKRAQRKGKKWKPIKPLRHTGDPVLRSHAMHAIIRRLPGGKVRFDRASQSRAKRKQDERVIDGLTAAGFVNWFATSAPAAKKMAGTVDDYRINAV